MRFKNKTAFITGAAKRIGMEVALFFASNGANVCLHYNSSNQNVLELQSKIVSLGVKCEVFEADFNNPQLATKCLLKAIENFGKVDFLINNASVFKKTSILTINEEEFDRDFNVHLKAPLFLIQTFAKQTFQEGEGVVINLIDKNYIKRRTTYTSYLLAKKSLLNLTEFAAFELAPNIRVNAISPGFIIEEEEVINSYSQQQISEYVKKKLADVPLKTKGSIADIVMALDFLISSSYITGQNIIVDGGSFLY